MSEGHNSKNANEAHDAQRGTAKGANSSEREDMEIASLKVTWKPSPDPALERLPAGVRDCLGLVQLQMTREPQSAVGAMEYLVSKYPDVITFQNWLGCCYQALGQTAKARQVNETLLKNHPQYLFARLTLVEMMVREGEAEAARRLMFDAGPTLTALYPERESFHVTEVQAWFHAAGVVQAAFGFEAGVQSCIQVLDQIEPSSKAAKDLHMLLEPKNQEALQRLRERREWWNRREAGEDGP